MRDADGVHGEQTLNLTCGGQGDPRKRWEGMQVRSRKKYKDFKAALAHFRKENGHCLVPKKDKSPALSLCIPNVLFYSSIKAGGVVIGLADHLPKVGAAAKGVGSGLG